MTRPKSEGRPNYCSPRCPTLIILSLLSLPSTHSMLVQLITRFTTFNFQVLFLNLSSCDQTQNQTNDDALLSCMFYKNNGKHMLCFAPLAPPHSIHIYSHFSVPYFSFVFSLDTVMLLAIINNKLINKVRFRNSLLLLQQQVSNNHDTSYDFFCCFISGVHFYMRIMAHFLYMI